MPVGNALVGDTSGDVEHDHGALSLDVVAVPESAEFLLSSSVPDVETNATALSVEDQRVNFDSEGGDVFLFKLAGYVAFDEGGFAHTTVSDEDELESRHVGFSRHGLGFVNEDEQRITDRGEKREYG